MFERHTIVTAGLPFSELKARSLIDQRANAADAASEFFRADQSRTATVRKQKREDTVTVLIGRAHNYTRAKTISGMRPRSHVSQQQVSYSVPQHTMNKLSNIFFFLPRPISPLRKLNHRTIATGRHE